MQVNSSLIIKTSGLTSQVHIATQNDSLTLIGLLTESPVELHHDSLPLRGFYPFLHTRQSNVILSTHIFVTSPLPFISSPNLLAVFARFPVAMLCITSVSSA